MAIEIDYYITMVSKNNELVNLKGSSLTFSAHGWWGKEKNLVAAKISVRPSKGMAEGGCGGNSAIPLQKIEASPAALLVKARHHRKILFSLGEKEIRRAQNEKSKEYFSVVWRVVASGGGLASLVPLEKGSRKVYNYSTRSNLFGIKNMERFCRSQNRVLIFAKTLSACGGSLEIP